VLTPDQFFRPATNPTVAWRGARQLLLAVLDNAVEAVFRYRPDHSRRGRRLLKETLDWFRSADQQWLYSFENICIHLHFDADYLRRGLERLSDPTTAFSASSPSAYGKAAPLVGRTRNSAGE
jgi:hypothetical protein